MWSKIFNKNKKLLPKTLKEMLNAGMISKEEFFRFRITQQEVALVKSKEELASFLKKQKKK